MADDPKQEDAKPEATSAGSQPATAANPASGYLDKVNRDFKEKAVVERANQMNMNYVDLSEMPINPDYLALVSRDKAEQAYIIPFFKIGKKVRVAIAHPTNKDTLGVIKELKDQGFQININLASEEGVLEAMKHYDSPQFKPEEKETENIVDEEQLDAYAQEIENLQALKDKLVDVTAEDALNVVNVGAMKTKASDIHYQPETDHVKVRFRIDGVLQDIFDLDLKTYRYLANQLKFKAKMKLNVNNEPQDGRFYFNFNQRKIDVRASALPTEYGETFVLRLLDSGKKSMTFEDMGFMGRNLELLNAGTKIANGMILVTGPTGSGKTTTLYAMLKVFNTTENKVITLEDPIEYHIENVAQSQINEKRGYTFGNGLRSILRQDPNVVMLGEIRDIETAETAAQAALTGHVLLSTLHTNSAVETVPRLLNIGLKPYMIAPAIHTVVAQRLVRVLCPDCRAKKPTTAAEKEDLERILEGIRAVQPSVDAQVPAELYHAVGCDKCSHTGYSGQTALAEIFELNDEIRQVILDEKSTKEIFETVRKTGMLTLKEDGVLKVIAEMTTLEEIQRVAEE